jgi:hypothetical protein
MCSKVLTEHDFLKDVSRHQMQILHDDGVSRHLSFKKPGTRSYSFDLITWPGHLCYTGDMGTYVFSRLLDMFEFFRTDQDYSSKDGETLRINTGYWAEKVLAQDRFGGIEQYDSELFMAAVLSALPEDASPELREAVQDQVLDTAHDEYDALSAIIHFEFEGFSFHDFWENKLKEFTHRFVWCCYALAWGIKVYDEAKAVHGQAERAGK